MSDADLVILGTDVGGGNTDVMYRCVQNGKPLLQVPATPTSTPQLWPREGQYLYAYGGPEAVKGALQTPVAPCGITSW